MNQVFAAVKCNVYILSMYWFRVPVQKIAVIRKVHVRNVDSKLATKEKVSKIYENSAWGRIGFLG